MAMLKKLMMNKGKGGFGGFGGGGYGGNFSPTSLNSPENGMDQTSGGVAPMPVNLPSMNSRGGFGGFGGMGNSMGIPDYLMGFNPSRMGFGMGFNPYMMGGFGGGGFGGMGGMGGDFGGYGSFGGYGGMGGGMLKSLSKLLNSRRGNQANYKTADGMRNPNNPGPSNNMRQAVLRPGDRFYQPNLTNSSYGG